MRKLYGDFVYIAEDLKLDAKRMRRVHEYALKQALDFAEEIGAADFKVELIIMPYDPEWCPSYAKGGTVGWKLTAYGAKESPDKYVLSETETPKASVWPV